MPTEPSHGTDIPLPGMSDHDLGIPPEPDEPDHDLDEYETLGDAQNLSSSLTAVSTGGSEPMPSALPEPPHPINWDELSPDDAAAEWLALDHWVNWLRHTYGLPAAIIPPYWHRHPELVWELSALHLHWLGAYDPEQHGSAPIGWHRDFAETRERLRDWVNLSGTKLDRDRPTRHTLWPGETNHNEGHSQPVVGHRAHDFAHFVRDDINDRMRLNGSRQESETCE